ncbi:MAG TPA: hypothetical protein DCM70_05290 [Rhodobacteraceae bacterium]|nr:hypothetical protein [Paracoccaceae bacterium]
MALTLICPCAFAAITGTYALPRLIFINATPCYLLNVICANADLSALVKNIRPALDKPAPPTDKGHSQSSAKCEPTCADAAH